MNYIAECLEKFRELPTVLKDFYNSWEVLGVISDLEAKHPVKLSFLMILLAIGELEEDDIEDYLTQKFKIAAEDAEDISDELITKIIDPASEKVFAPLTVASSNQGSAKPADPNLSKELILSVFSKSLVEHLSASSDDLKKFNIVIFQALNQDENLEEKVISALYANQEKLTGQKLIVDGQEVVPTASNWLKDFIKVNGSDMFNEIVLAEYLTNSENVKKLKPEEKDLVRKLLKLYKNLVFFPESMENVPLENWEIFPLDITNSDQSQAAKPQENKAAELATEKKAAEPARKTVAVSKAIETPKQPEPLSPDEQMIAELQLSLPKYDASSLEYKAISQEIKRLQKKSLKK